MTRLAVLVALLGLLAPSGTRHDEKACDLKNVAEAPWCPKCKGLRDSDGVDKEGKCTECKTQTDKVKVCVKAYYKANC